MARAAALTRRVVFVHSTPEVIGGSQHSMLAEADALTEAGWQVLIIHGESQPLAAGTSARFAGELHEPAVFGHHPSRGMQHGLRRLAKFLEAERPLVAHLHLWPRPMLFRFLVDRLPTVATCHVPVCPNGARFHYTQERICEHAVGPYCVTRGYRQHGCATTADGRSYGLPAFTAGLAYARWTLRLLARCNGVIAPSFWQRQMLIADGVPAERVVVIPPPIGRAHAAAAAGDGTDALPVVLAAGRLMVLKGMHHLLRASARVERPHELHLAGDGPALPELRGLAEALGIADRTRFLGSLEPDRLAAAFAGAAAVLVPSLWPETFGMVGPEALLAGTPVIAYAGGGIPDWARAEYGARSVAVGDIPALAREINSAVGQPRRVNPAQIAKVRDGYSPQRHTAALLELYERIVAR
jgi:glycosyltransferase involved in cell wall biosynthesis